MLGQDAQGVKTHMGILPESQYCRLWTTVQQTAIACTVAISGIYLSKINVSSRNEKQFTNYLPYIYAVFIVRPE